MGILTGTSRGGARTVSRGLYYKVAKPNKDIVYSSVSVGVWI